MKKLILFSALITFLFSCEPEIKNGNSIGENITKLYDGDVYLTRVYMLKLDSVDYIIVCSSHGVAITPKIKNK